VTDRALPRSHDLDDIATGRVDIDDVGTIDPRMSTADSLLSAGVDHDERHSAQCSMLNAQKASFVVDHYALGIGH
jgi:hypothetical protein